MAILRAKEIRKLESKDLSSRVHDLRLELAKERANIHIGATVTSPGRIREIRKSIARVLTVENERKVNKTKPVKASEVKKESKEAKAKEESKKEKADTKTEEATKVKPIETKSSKPAKVEKVKETNA